MSYLNVKKASGHPTFNTVILGISSALTTISAISGFISYGKLGNDPEVNQAKKMILTASLLSLFSAILLGLGLFLIHRHAVKMESTFKGFFSLTLLTITGLFVLVSGIIYSVAAAKINKQKYGTAHSTAVVSAVLTFIGFGLLCMSLLMAFMALRKQPQMIRPTLSTPSNLIPPYTNVDSAKQQLEQLQTGSRVGVSASSQQTL